MIQITAQMRVLVAIEPVDGRKGIDSLARLCQEKLAEDPFSGCVFVFRSRRGTSIRLLTYDLCAVSSNVQSTSESSDGVSCRGDLTAHYFRGPQATATRSHSFAKRLYES